MNHNRIKEGIIYAAVAFSFWGVIPLYWKLLTHLSAWEMLFHRVLWGSIPLVLYLALTKQLSSFKHLKEGRNLALALSATALIISNWVIFIWAVTNNHVLEVSLGYFLNPIFNVILGTFFLGERLRPKQQGAVALAAVGLAIMFAQDLGAPWIALALAGTFSLYGLVRKKAPLAPAQGLFFEMFVALICMLPLLNWLVPFSFPQLSLREQFIASLAGPITLFPLIFYNRAVKLIPYSLVGIIQYLAPTLQFILAVAIFHERFELRHALAFGFIWFAVILYLLESLSKRRQTRQNKINAN